MLKDIFTKKKKDNTNEKILKSIADGYVDIKAYKHFDDGSKKLVYHDTGDNTVTNWMRHAIMLMLSGYSLSNSGNDSFNEETSQTASEQITKPLNTNHTDSINADGYCLNGSQYLWSYDDLEGYPVEPSDLYANTENVYAMFPTKILLGTGCEYTDWDSLKEENEEDNATWYANMVKQYGDGDEDLAAQNFNMLTGVVESTGGEVENYTCNVYSGTIGVQGVYSGNGTIQKSVTVNDPDTTTNISTSADMANRYGVVGAIKTLYLPNEKDEFSREILENTVSDSGRLLQGKYRGAGRPCFVYFNRTKIESGDLDWDKQVSDIYVSKDTSTDFLNRITFRVIIPAQSSGTGQVGTYCPFNGYTFKQVGLFNDALFSTRSTGISSSEASIAGRNMPCGMLLAIKNIQNFSKTADTSIEFTWTLTI